MTRRFLSASALLLASALYLGCSNKPAPVPVAEEVAPPATESDPAATVVKPGEPTPADNPPAATAAAEPPLDNTPPVDANGLINRRILFGNPDRAAARLSHDGQQLSYLAPVAGVLNVWVGPVKDPDAAKPVTQDTKRGIRSYFWAYTNRHILYAQDADGDENWHVYAVDITSGKTTDLTPYKGVAAQIDNVSEKFPDEIVVGLNDRDPQFHDLYRIHIGTGERKLLQQNPDFAGFVVDDDYHVRFAERMLPSGDNQLYVPDGDNWKEFQTIPQADTLTTSPAGFDKTGRTLFMLDSRGRNTAALTAVNLDDGAVNVLAQNELADAGSILQHPTEKNIQAVAFTYDRTRWQVLDPAIEPDLDYLQTVADGEMQVVSRTLDDKAWIVGYVMDNGPVRYYHFNRETKQAKFLFSNRKALEDLPLVKMHPRVLNARDGLKLVSYLSLPRDADDDGDGVPKSPLPLILNVHGGPWARDSWGFDPEHQLFANRGYAVLSVNFRGSTGFGKGFTNAGDKQWAATMHDDLLDAVDWAVKEKIADPAKVCILGGSYGGYATLVGLTFTPDKFACGVDIVGPSNLITLLKTIPPYWAPALQMFKDRVGDLTTEEGQKLLEERSPLRLVEKIQRPLLIGQGANDPRVKQSESDQIVAAMKKNKIPVTYVLFPDEGHGFARPENNLAFYAVTEQFLAKNLGGKAQPIGDAFRGSTIRVPEGADQVRGLENVKP